MDLSGDSWQPARRLDRGNAAEQIFVDLRSQILAGRFPRGTKLPSEKQLAEAYGVSGPTVREAIRGLTTVHLIEVQHGRGAYVTANASQLVDVSLSSMIQMERVNIRQVLGVLGALNCYAAELAATHVDIGRVQEMRGILEEIAGATESGQIADGFLRFTETLAAASGNPLLIAFCKFLAGIQIRLARELSGDSFEVWRKTASKLAKDRKRLVEAIAGGHPEEAREAARAFHDRALTAICALPNASATMLDDATLSTFVASLLRNLS